MKRRTWKGTAPRTGEAGQTMAEYAVVLAIITIAVVLTFTTLGDAAGGLIEDVSTFL